MGLYETQGLIVNCASMTNMTCSLSMKQTLQRAIKNSEPTPSKLMFSINLSPLYSYFIMQRSDFNKKTKQE